MDRYNATKTTIRISHENSIVVSECAQELAGVTAERLGVDGANIIYGSGLWKGAIEPSAAIEIVTHETPINEDMQRIRNHVTAMGLTAFVTVEQTTAFELC